MRDSLIDRGRSQVGAIITEQALLFAFLLPLVIVAVRPLGIQVQRSVYCSMQTELGGGSSTTEDLPESHGPPGGIHCAAP